MESLVGLRAVADAELVQLGGRFEEVAHGIAPAGVIAQAVAEMESDHPAARSLIDEAAGPLDRLPPPLR